MSFHPDITEEWYADNNCSFYQSYVDTVFLCNDVEVYVLPRERSFEELGTLTNIYDPAAFGFNGQIERIFTSSGDTDKMYMLETYTDEQTQVSEYMTLELFNGEIATSTEGEDGSVATTTSQSAQIRTVYALPNGLEAEWFHLSADNSWFIFIRAVDEFLALMEIDLEAENYRNSTGTLSGKTVTVIGSAKALARDFDPATNLFTYITPERKFVQKKITKLFGDTFQLSYEDEPLSELMSEALEVNGVDDITRYATYSRYKDFWIFADDQNATASGKVTAIAKDKVINFSSNEVNVVEYGKHAWMSTDTNAGDEENILVAISSMTSIEEPI